MKILLTVFSLGFGTMVTAQNIFDSPYSIYGLGLINNRLSTLNRGMGGTGVAIRDGFNLNYVNPASYGSIASPINNMFEMGFYVQRNTYRTNELSESTSNGSLTNMNYWFKPKPKWASIIGLTPFSSVSYKISTLRSLGGIPAADYTYEGSGTISQLYWGNGFNILKNLSLGFNISYLFGSISKSESIDILNQSSRLMYENKIFTNKIKADAGLQYVIPLKKNKSLVVGLVGDDGITFTANQKNYLYDGSLDTLNTAEGEKLRYAIPSSFGVGLSLQSNRSIIASDLKFQDWSTIRAEQDVAYQDTWNFSLGYMYKGNPEATDYFGAVSLRAGFHIQDYYLRLKENNLPWWGMTVGISLPMFDNRSSVNISYSFDQLGTLKNGLILQRAQQIMFDVVVRDLWGMRRRFE
jgi:hypothetical protein